jgi:hypothetical protein
VLAGEDLDGGGTIARGGQRPVQVRVGAQDVRQDQGVSRVGLATRLAGALAVARDGPRVDRVDREPAACKAATSRTFSLSIATSTLAGSATCSASKAISAVKPLMPVSMRSFARRRPSGSTSATSWCPSAQSIPQVIVMCSLLFGGGLGGLSNPRACAAT